MQHNDGPYITREFELLSGEKYTFTLPNDSKLCYEFRHEIVENLMVMLRQDLGVTFSKKK